MTSEEQKRLRKEKDALRQAKTRLTQNYRDELRLLNNEIDQSLSSTASRDDVNSVESVAQYVDVICGLHVWRDNAYEATPGTWLRGQTQDWLTYLSLSGTNSFQ